ncbi:hypothetical protein CYMTET_13300 [Cymbomonas tetramitiformis]|uniref:Sialyltransferase-like protein n=1 Tax=Cymbomonas tetramitiformis TaxID=36881 RepID=A0AAE0GIY6_9CHLO|nr:hypothetical protein CYMTET_13300 [Cymbomonas tetramitiformis]
MRSLLSQHGSRLRNKDQDLANILGSRTTLYALLAAAICAIGLLNIARRGPVIQDGTRIEEDDEKMSHPRLRPTVLCSDPQNTALLREAHTCISVEQSSGQDLKLAGLPTYIYSAQSRSTQPEVGRALLQDVPEDSSARQADTRSRAKSSEVKGVRGSRPSGEKSTLQTLAEKWRPITQENAFVHKQNARRSVYRDDEQLLAALPSDALEASEGLKYTTCAVVGNSGILRKTAYGADIDAHDAVIRLNQGPTKGGCSYMVGGRTTLRVLSFTWLHKYARGVQGLPRDDNVTFILSQFQSEDVKQLVKAAAGTPESLKLRIISQQMWGGVQLLLHGFKNQLKKQFGVKGMGAEAPSTGMLGVYLALCLCEKVTLYGFPSPNERPSSLKNAYHYFDHGYARKGLDTTHMFDVERLLLQALAMTSRLKLCTYAAADGNTTARKPKVTATDAHVALQIAAQSPSPPPPSPSPPPLLADKMKVIGNLVSSSSASLQLDLPSLGHFTAGQVALSEPLPVLKLPSGLTLGDPNISVKLVDEAPDVAPGTEGEAGVHGDSGHAGGGTAREPSRSHTSTSRRDSSSRRARPAAERSGHRAASTAHEASRSSLSDKVAAELENVTTASTATSAAASAATATNNQSSVSAEISTEIDESKLSQEPQAQADHLALKTNLAEEASAVKSSGEEASRGSGSHRASSSRDGIHHGGGGRLRRISINIRIGICIGIAAVGNRFWGEARQYRSIDR